MGIFADHVASKIATDKQKDADAQKLIDQFEVHLDESLAVLEKYFDRDFIEAHLDFHFKKIRKVSNEEAFYPVMTLEVPVSPKGVFSDRFRLVQEYDVRDGSQEYGKYYTAQLGFDDGFVGDEMSIEKVADFFDRLVAQHQAPTSD